MDWVIEAAKRKTKRPPGSSRSIVESLNIFNEIVSEGQSELSSILNDADNWLKQEDSVPNVEINKGSRYAHETSSLVSPEKTESTFAMDFKERSFSDKADNGCSSDRNETPMRIGEALPSTTPKSLAGDNSTEDIKRSEPDRTVTESIADVEKEKRAVWSPYRNEGTLRETSGALPEVVKQNVTNEPQRSPHITLRNIDTSKPTGLHGNASPATNRLHQVARDRSQRRSNMFVPLPSKDPLVVHHAIPENSAGSKSSIPMHQATTSSNYAKGKPNKVPFDKRRSLNFQDTPSGPVKLKSATRKSRSPGYDTGGSGVTNVPKFTTSVFDRLSSLPTKSFENKITTKAGERKVSSSSSIDVTGSPMRRTSLSFRSSVVTDASIQETLKNIFSSKDSIHGATKSHAISDLNSGKVLKKGLATRTKSRNLKIPELSKRSTGFIHDNNVSQSKTILKEEGAPETAVESASDMLGGESKSSVNNIAGNMPSNELKISNEEKLNQTDQNHNNWNSKAIQSLFEIEETNASLSGEQQNKSRNHDRLTKFQLLPPVESEKDDLKRKLSKRLSEVMRTQQNQQRRRHEQQKRKSHLEDDFKRRTRLWNEVKEAPTAAHLNLATSLDNNPISQKLDQNTILHDLHSVDHRNYIGGDSHLNDSQLDNENEAGNQTLPEINSDSDEEKDAALPSWAKSPYLQDQLYLQQNWDPKKIFGALPPLHIDEIFQISRLNRLKSRQSTTRRI